MSNFFGIIFLISFYEVLSFTTLLNLPEKFAKLLKICLIILGVGKQFASFDQNVLLSDLFLALSVSWLCKPY